MSLFNTSTFLRFTGPLILAAGLPCGGMAEEFLVGLARVDVTPAEAIRLTGYASRSTNSTGVAQRIWAKAVAIGADADAPAVLITLDNCGIAEQTYLEVADRLRQKAGIPRERMTIACSHSHSGPCTTYWAPNIFAKDIPVEDQKIIDRYTRILIQQLEQVALKALKSRQPGRLSWSQGSVDFARNRRTAGGAVDHALPVLKIEDGQGRLLGIVANYACHCTTLGGEFNKVHGDWAGCAQEAIERDHPGAIALITIGCGADSNPSPRGTLDLVRQHGESIATEVTRLLGQTFTPLTNKLSAQQKRIELPFAAPFSRAQWEERAKKNGIVGYHAQKNLGRLSRGESLPTELPYYVQTWSFGGQLALIFLNGEVVVDYALQIKKEFDAARVWVSGYSGYVPCYIPSKRILREGGYEAEDSLWYYDRPARLAPESEDLILDAVRELMPKSYRFDQRKAEFPDPKSPEEALATFRTKADLVVELMASEPLIESPVAIDWDAQGRIWVCEMYDYPTGVDRKWKPGGRIKVLTDTDGDGKPDRATLFLDGLAFPTGVMPWGKGALICAAPDILYAEDTDGDGRADLVRTNFTGFATHNFQARVNGFTWGLDGWLHGSSGLFGGKVTSLLTGRRVDLGGRDFRMNPDSGEIEPLAGISQMGRVRDDFDNWFGNDNSTLLWHYPLPDHYVRRNPQASYPEPRLAVARGEDPNKLHPASRTLERFNDPGSANRVTSACGPEIYRDDLLGTNYYGNSFTCEPVHNLVRRMILQRDGTSFTGRQASDEKQGEFLASTDNWFRPVQVRTGRDGALWIVDLYRFVVEHPRWISPERLAQLDVRAGADKGRLYRISRRGVALRRVRNLTQMDGPALVAALGTTNGPTRDLVQREFLQRRPAVTPGAMAGLATSSPHGAIRVQALCLVSALFPDIADRILARSWPDGSPEVQRVVSRLCEPYLRKPETAAAILSEWRRAPRDGSGKQVENRADLAVRFQVALSLGEARSKGVGKMLADLAMEPSDWLRAAVLSSMEADPWNLIEATRQWPVAVPGRAGFLGQLLRAVIAMGGETNRHRALEAVMPGSSPLAADATGVELLAMVLDGFDDVSPASPGYLTNSIAGQRAIEAMAMARLTATNVQASGEMREASVRLLARMPDATPQDVGLLCEVLERPSSDRQRDAALQRLRSQRDVVVAKEVLARWGRFSTGLRPRLIGLLVSRDSFTLELLASLKSGVVAATEVLPADRQRLLQHASQEIRGGAEAIFRLNRSRAEVVARYQRVSDLAGEPQRGGAVFDRTCATCHALRGHGQAVGPNLAEYAGKAAADFVVAILDPNSAINPAFLAYTVETRDGRTLSGIVRGETAAGLTLVQGGGVSETLLRSDYREIRASPVSLMPEGLEQNLTPQDLADLVAWIKKAAPAPFGGAVPEQIAKARAEYLSAGGKGVKRVIQSAETLPYPGWLGRLPMPYCRQTAGQNQLAWQASPMAVARDRDRVQHFRLPIAMGLVSAPAGRFELRINGRPAFEFNVALTDATWQSADGSVRMTYTVMEANAEDSNGIMDLEVGTEWLKTGEPARFEVIGSEANSQRWFGLYLLEANG